MNDKDFNNDSIIQSPLVGTGIDSLAQNDGILSEVDRNQNKIENLDGILTGAITGTIVTGAITGEKIDGKI